MIMEEIWRPVVGWEGLYEISTMGNVRSVDKNVGMRTHGKKTTKFVKGRMLTPQHDKDGYTVIHLRDTFNGRNRLLKVHRLVAETFIPNPNNYPAIDHINGIRDDNRVENIRWCTISQNANFELAHKNRSESIRKSYENNPKLREIRSKTFGKCNCIPVDVWYNGEYIGRFESMVYFCRKYSLNQGAIWKSTKECKDYKGYFVKKVKKDA